MISVRSAIGRLIAIGPYLSYVVVPLRGNRVHFPIIVCSIAEYSTHFYFPGRHERRSGDNTSKPEYGYHSILNFFRPVRDRLSTVNTQSEGRA
jgi:hypothetical protein